MDLKTFVSQSLIQILDGIREAQKAPGGENVAAEAYIGSEGNLIAGGTSGHFTKVDFDVLVLAETKDGNPSVRVGDVQTTSDTHNVNQNASRVKFAVHVRLPLGGKAPKDNGYASSYDHDD